MMYGKCTGMLWLAGVELDTTDLFFISSEKNKGGVGMDMATTRQINFIHQLLKDLGLNASLKFDPSKLDKETASKVIDRLITAVKGDGNGSSDRSDVEEMVELYADIWSEVTTNEKLSELNVGEHLRIATTIFIQLSRERSLVRVLEGEDYAEV